DEGEVLRGATEVPGELGPGAIEELGHAASEEVDRLLLELPLPCLVALEDRTRAGAERAVIEERDLGVEEELAPELGWRRCGHRGLLLLHPKLPPTRGPAKRAASHVTNAWRLCDESPAPGSGCPLRPGAGLNSVRPSP